MKAIIRMGETMIIGGSSFTPLLRTIKKDGRSILVYPEYSKIIGFIFLWDHLCYSNNSQVYYLSLSGRWVRAI